MAEGSNILDKKTECELAIAHVSLQLSVMYPQYPRLSAKFNTNCIEEAFEEIEVLIDDVSEGFDESVILEDISNDINIKYNDKESLCNNIHKLLSTFVPPRSEPQSLNIADLDTSFEPQDMYNIKTLVTTYAKLLEPNNADTSIYKVLIIGQKNNIPLLSYLIDTYQRFRLSLYFEHRHQCELKEHKMNEFEEPSLDRFCLIFCPTMKELRFRVNNAALLWYKSAMESCIHRNGLFYCLPLMQAIPSKINDSLHIFHIYSVSILKSVNDLIKKENAIYFPTQIDIWFIPKSITQQIFDGDDNADEDVFDLNARLIHCDNVRSMEIEANMDDIDGLSDIFGNAIKNVLNKQKRKRIVMIIDRRCVSNQSDILYVYLPPNTQNIADCEHYLHESMINLTKTEIVPSISGELNDSTIGANSDFQNMFVLSLHLHREVECAMYWHYIGSCNRFCINDMMTLWPSQFISNDKYDCNLYDSALQWIQTDCDSLIDVNFIAFYEENTESYWKDTEAPLFRAKPMIIIEQKDNIERRKQKLEKDAKYRCEQQCKMAKYKLQMTKNMKSRSFEFDHEAIKVSHDLKYGEGDTKIDDCSLKMDDIDIAFDDCVCIDFVYSHDFDRNGLLYFLATNAKRKEYNNPCFGEYVSVSFSSLAPDSKDSSYFVGRECVRCITKNESPSWMSVAFNCIWMKLTHYTLKHHNSHNAALIHWTLEASNDGNKWIILKNHICDESLRKPGDTATWTIETKQNDYFSRFRIFMTDSNSSGRWYLGCSGIELYGNAFVLQSTSLMNDDGDQDNDDQDENKNKNNNLNSTSKTWNSLAKLVSRNNLSV